jgi:hypothetical protein
MLLGGLSHPVRRMPHSLYALRIGVEYPLAVSGRAPAGISVEDLAFHAGDGLKQFISNMLGRILADMNHG